MRSTTALVLLILIQPWAFAAVQVGDQVTYSMKNIANNGDEILGLITTTVTKVDSGHDRINLKNTVRMNNETKTTEVEYALSGIVAQESELENNLEKYCRPAGILEVVKVPAGTFKACKVQILGKNTTYQWQAAGVGIFNFVRQETFNADKGVTTQVELIEHKIPTSP